MNCAGGNYGGQEFKEMILKTMGKTRREHDLEIEEQVKMMPSLLRRAKKTIEVPHTVPHTEPYAVPSPSKSKFNEGKFNVASGQKIKRFLNKLISLHARFTWEQLEMIKSLSKCLKTTNTFMNIRNITNNMSNLSNNMIIYKYQNKTFYNKKEEEEEEDNNSEGKLN